MNVLLTKGELNRIRNDWKITDPSLAVNEQLTINRLIDLVDAQSKVIESYTRIERDMEDDCIHLQQEIAKKDVQLEYFTKRTSEYAHEVSSALRYLMESYRLRDVRLNKELKEAKRDDLPECVEAVKALRRQCRMMKAELFQAMAKVGVLDAEEIEFGDLKVSP